MGISGQAKARLCNSRETDLPQLHELFDFLFKQDALLSVVFTDEILDGETREKKRPEPPLEIDIQNLKDDHLQAPSARKPVPGKAISSPAWLLLSSISRPSSSTF